MVRYFLVFTLIAGMAASGGFRRKKYENPITKDTKQPDKVLFDKAINDIEHGRYEVARITLNTMINTYDQSEFLAKAKLAIADSWYREGGAHGLAQAEAEYKDFILFYPTLEEAAESQEKVCMIHYRQMEKADRDPSQALRAQDECRQMVVQFPNSKFVPEAQQILRNIQEGLAEGEFRVGFFYHKKGSNPAAANRLSLLTEQFPLYSRADEALWDLGDSYSKMGNRFRQKAGEAYARIVKDYPYSGYVDAAKKRLNELELPVPEADRVAYDRMKWEAENRQKPGMIARSSGFLKRGPDVSSAARSGAPAMTNLRPSVPASVPVPAGAAPGFTGDVVANVVTDSTALNTQPDARMNPPVPGAAPAAGAKPGETAATPATATAGAATTPTAAKATAPATPEPLPTNYQPRQLKKKKKTKKQEAAEAAAAARATTPAAATPAEAAPAAAQPATATTPAKP